ncbi:MAG: cadherin repeat domain-containing protein [Saprospirales bacterium]|nr:cadherin repeat domain-containing protein [Saprospirales bacterium]
MFQLRGSLTGRQSIILGIAGLLIFLGIWWLLAEAFAVDRNEAELNLPPDPDAEEMVTYRLRDSDPLENAVLENAGEGTYTGLTIAFPDTAHSNGGAFFSLVDNANGTFSIDPVTGRVVVARAQGLDYERATSLSIVVSGEDGKGRKQRAIFISRWAISMNFP